MQIMLKCFRSLEEVDYVGEKLRPQLEARLLAKGYVVLFWGDSGWVQLFSKAPVINPDDLRKLKVFSGAGNANEFNLWNMAILFTQSTPGGRGWLKTFRRPPLLQVERGCVNRIGRLWKSSGFSPVALEAILVSIKVVCDRVPAMSSVSELLTRESNSIVDNLKLLALRRQKRPTAEASL